MTLHRLPEPLPRAFVVHEAVIADGEEALALLAADQFDPGRQAVLAQPPPIALPGGPASPATVVERQPGRLVVETAPARDGLLVLSEVEYPGWQARVDGQPAPIVRADYALRGIPLRAGAHRVDLVFEPWSAQAGIVVSALALLAAAGLLAGVVLLRRRATRP